MGEEGSTASGVGRAKVGQRGRLRARCRRLGARGRFLGRLLLGFGHSLGHFAQVLAAGEAPPPEAQGLQALAQGIGGQVFTMQFVSPDACGGDCNRQASVRPN